MKNELNTIVDINSLDNNVTKVYKQPMENEKLSKEQIHKKLEDTMMSLVDMTPDAIEGLRNALKVAEKPADFVKASTAILDRVGIIPAKPNDQTAEMINEVKNLTSSTIAGVFAGLGQLFGDSYSRKTLEERLAITGPKEEKVDYEIMASELDSLIPDEEEIQREEQDNESVRTSERTPNGRGARRTRKSENEPRDNESKNPPRSPRPRRKATPKKTGDDSRSGPSPFQSDFIPDERF